MIAAGIEFNGNLGILLIGVAAAAIYIGSRIGVDALVDRHTAQPGRRALGHWLPIALVAICAAQMKRPEIALGVIFSTSVASLSLVMGSVVIQAPASTPASRGRTWAFLLPAALITLLAGFKGRLEWYHGLILLLEGIVIWVVWIEESRQHAESSIFERSNSYAPSRRVIHFAVALVLCALGAYAAVQGTIEVSATVAMANGGLISAALLSPLLTLPMIGAGQTLAEHGKTWEASAAHIGVALLNLCLALPIIIFQWHAIVLARLSGDGLIPRVLAYPVGVWRVDSVILVVIGLMLIPVSLGRWVLGRGEGLALIVGYVMYVCLAIAAAW